MSWCWQAIAAIHQALHLVGLLDHLVGRVDQHVAAIGVAIGKLEQMIPQDERGQSQLTYNEVIDAKAGSDGALKIPQTFNIGVRIFKNGEGYADQGAPEIPPEQRLREVLVRARPAGARPRRHLQRLRLRAAREERLHGAAGQGF